MLQLYRYSHYTYRKEAKIRKKEKVKEKIEEMNNDVDILETPQPKKRKTSMDERPTGGSM